MSEAAHATAVLIATAGVLIRGESGSGKSALAAWLIGRGARLVADDRVFLSACHGRLIASAPASIAGKLELRGRGILTVPHERAAVIRLVVDIAAGVERLPERGHFETNLLGLTLPCQPVPSDLPHAVLLIEAALAALLPHRNMNLQPAGL